MSRIMNDVNLIQGAVSGAVTGILKDLFTILGLIGSDLLPGLATGRPGHPGPAHRRPAHRQIRAQVAQASAPRARRPWPRSPSTCTRPCPGTGSSRPSAWKNRRCERFNEREPHFFSIDHEGRLGQGHVLTHHGVPGRDLGIAAIIWYGGYNVIRGTSTPGTFFPF